MENSFEKINQLHDKLDYLLKRQDEFSKEIDSLRLELNELKTDELAYFLEESESIDNPIVDSTFVTENEEKSTETYFDPYVNKEEEFQPIDAPESNVSKGKSDLEKFIGENLINKVGIAITIIGVAIGAKYTIENNLITPLTRIILGYLFGLGLLGFGIKLKSNFENFSAVLVSGAMAILYFITFAAYDFYDLFPQLIAFSLMVFFTIFTVIASLNYNLQIIALIALVGAYAVPFLLSDGSGKVAVLFSYVAILNTGILIIAFKKYWKLLYFVSFALTWFIFFTWFMSSFRADENIGLSLLFNSIFFITFYLTFLAYKLLQKEKFLKDDIILLLLNSFLFYSFGYTTLNGHETGQYFLGIFTVVNAIIHFGVSIVIFKQKYSDKNLFNLIIGLVLVFITIAIPVQMDGNWVTLFWAIEATLLFWIGRTKSSLFYEKISYLLMIFAFFSIIGDWSIVYDSYDFQNPENNITPFLNVHFLTSILFIAAFGCIAKINFDKKYVSEIPQTSIFKFTSLAILFILLFTTYYAIRLEIANYWNQLYDNSFMKIYSGSDTDPNFYRNQNLENFKIISILIYSLLFVSILTFINNKRFKNQLFGNVNMYLILLALIVFLTQGLYVLSELRVNFLNQELSPYYKIGEINLWIRYFSFLFVALILFASYKNVQQNFSKKTTLIPFELILHVTILWIASSELINLMEIAESTQSHKLGLSIFWGIYSLLLISIGIWKNNKTLRIGAIILFAGTLLKLFFYDISHLNTISKTIVFVSLGILLLIISFLYNKFKEKISDEES